MKKNHYIVIAVVSYLLFLFASIPAKPVAGLINDNTAVRLQGVSGSLWNGRAYSLMINSSIELKNTEWSFTLWKLLSGRLAMDINALYADNVINAETGITFTGRYFTNSLTLSLPAEAVAEIASIPLAQLSGLITLDIEHAHWKQGELPVARGQVTWKNAAVTVAETASLGDVLIQLGESDKQLLRADISNKGGDISVTGSAEIVPEANYTVNILLTPAASADNSISQSLGMFAKRQGNGGYLLKRSGALSELGLL